MLIATSTSTPCVILFVSVLVRTPVIHEKIVAFLSKLQCHLVFPVTVQSLINQIIRRSPYVASPIELVLKGGIIARDGGNHILPPKLLWINQMFRHHSLRLSRSRNSSHHWIEVGWRQAPRKMPVPISVFINAVLLIPELSLHGRFYSFVVGRETAPVVLIPENFGNLRQTF